MAVSLREGWDIAMAGARRYALRKRVDCDELESLRIENARLKADLKEFTDTRLDCEEAENRDRMRRVEPEKK